jgi:hypothetical protein
MKTVVSTAFDTTISSPVAAATTTIATTTSKNPEPPSISDNDSLSKTEIAGILLGVIAAVITAADAWAMCAHIRGKAVVSDYAVEMSCGWEPTARQELGFML